MKKIFKKKIIKGMLVTLVMFLGGLVVNAEIPDLEKSLSASQREIYDSLSLCKKEEIKQFYISLNDTIQDRYRRNNSKNDFSNFLVSVNQFLNSEINSRVRKMKAYVIGVANLDDGSYIINTRHLRIFILKCKSLINGRFNLLGYVGCDVRDNRAKNFFADFILPYNNLRQWSSRVKINIDTVNDLSPSSTVSDLSPSSTVSDLSSSIDMSLFEYDRVFLDNQFEIFPSPNDPFYDPFFKD